MTLARRMSAGLLGLLLLVALLATIWVPGRVGGTLVRLLLATRGTVLLSLAVIVIAIPLGVLLGVLAARGGPLLDGLLARGIEVTGALPAVVLVAVVQAGVPERSAAGLLIALVALFALRTARLVRGELLQLGAAPFVEAARALGVPPGRLALRHLLPHVLDPVAVTAAFAAAAVVALEAALGLLDLGPPGLTWGALLADRAPSGGLWAASALVVATTAALYVLCDAPAGHGWFRPLRDRLGGIDRADGGLRGN